MHNYYGYLQLSRKKYLLSLRRKIVSLLGNGREALLITCIGLLFQPLTEMVMSYEQSGSQ
jgi:hypothetical protein